MVEYFKSHKGAHQDNEDFGMSRRHPEDRNCVISCLADGQGGRSGGRLAAKLGCEAFIEKMISIPVSKIHKPRLIEGALKLSDSIVCESSEAGFTTLVGFVLTDTLIVGGSCGDSMIICSFSNGDFFDLSSAQEKNPPVGSGGAKFKMFKRKLREDWVVFSMTDGVWKYAGLDSVLEISPIESVDSIYSRLLEKARLRSGRLQGDFTISAFSNKGQPVAVDNSE